MKKIFSIILLGAAIFMTAPCVTTVSAQQPSAKERIEAAKAQQQALFKAQQAQNDSLKAVREAQQAVYDARNTKYQRNLWLVIGVSVFILLISVFFRYKSLIISIIQIFTGGFRTKDDLTTLESKKILVGAIYASQQGAYLNTLKADIGAKLHTILKDWWGIYGRDEAIETLDYLRDKAYAYYFPTVWKAFRAGSDEERKSIITENMTSQEDAEKAYEQTHNLLESVNRLKNLKIIQHADDIEKYGVVGWDVGRLVFIARICFDAKYISEEEAWTYIDVAYAQAQRAFHSWEELAKSYQIGRFIWRGKDADDGMDSIANNLVTSPKSPWQQVSWR
jgi:hypothetical protein